MMRLPTLAAIDAAELRVVRARRNVQLSAVRTRSAVRTFIARPTTLLLVAVATSVSAFFLTPRRRPSVKSEPCRTASTIKAPSRSLLQTFISMYGARLLTLALQLHAAAGKKSEAGVDANPLGTTVRALPRPLYTSPDQRNAG